MSENIEEVKKKEYKMQTPGRKKAVKYATKERMAKVNPKNLEVYEAYIRSNTIKNRDVASTTYKVYRSCFNIFMCFIMEKHDNFYLLDEDIIEEEMIDIMEDYIAFLQIDLGNNKKSVNTKLSAVSSFYIWAVKRRKIKAHPFDGRLDRIANAQDEKIIAEYFLNEGEVEEIVDELSRVKETTCSYDNIDQLIWHIAFDSACRIGALVGLKESNLELDKRRFINIREKRGKIVNIPFTPETGVLIEEFIKQKRDLGIDCDEMFYTKRGGEYRGMSKQSISARIKKMGHIIGIGDFRPHCIRKTRLNMVAKLDINKAKTLGNHSSLDTTAKFYTEKEDQSDTLDSIMELERTKKDEKGK